MKQKIKWVSKRIRKETMVWAVDPSTAAKEALDVGYEQFYSYHEAKQRSLEIQEAFAEYKASKVKAKRIRAPKNTVDYLYEWWKEHKSYKELAVNSKYTYEQVYNSIRTIRIGESPIPFGMMMIKSVDAKTADKLHATIVDTISKHRADSAAKVLRRMWYVARRGLLPSGHPNPFSQMGLRKLFSRSVQWSDVQVSQFVSKADEMGVSSVGTLALLCYHLCQRPGDMRQMTWGQYDGSRVSFIQEKTKKYTNKPMSLMLTPDCIERLNALERGENDEVIIKYEPTGEGYDRFMYAKVARRVRRAAQLPDDLQIRDLRRSGATEMGEAGSTEDEIAAVTGHRSREMLNVYVNPTRKIADTGMHKRFSKKYG